MEPKVLVAIGDAWVDPAYVVSVDATFDEDDPPWARVRVTLCNGHGIYGSRDAKRVALAIRHPERDDYDEDLDREADGSTPETAAERAKRRHNGTKVSTPPPSLRPLSPKGT